jgi:hypothetical protein
VFAILWGSSTGSCLLVRLNISIDVPPFSLPFFCKAFVQPTPGSNAFSLGYWHYLANANLRAADSPWCATLGCQGWQRAIVCSLLSNPCTGTLVNW